jgi:hypothetical protein
MIRFRLQAVLPFLAAVLLTCAGCAAVGAPAGEVIEDEWCSVSLGGTRIGYVHTVTERRADPEPMIVTSVFNETRIRRFGAGLSFRTDVEFRERESGELFFAAFKMEGGGMSMASEAVLGPDKIVVTSRKAGGEEVRDYPLDEPVIGPYAQTGTLRASGFAPGTEVTFRAFVPDLQRVATSTVRFLGPETIEIHGAPMALHKAIMLQDVLPGIQIQAWVDDRGNIVRSVANALGTIETLQTTREEALRAIAPEDLSDLADTFFIRTNARFPNPKAVKEAVYKIKGDPADLGALDLEGRRQTLLERGEGWLRLRVQALPPPNGAEALGPEFSKPSLYLQSDDPMIKRAAEKAIQKAATPYEKAKALERWTYDNVEEKSYGVGFDSAKEVLLSRKGDCTEHSVLLAALLRAADIPSRVVVGITYWRGGFTYHMWTEAWLDGWTALDATLVGEFVDATHIGLAKTALDTPSAAEPFLSLVNVVGKISVEVEESSQ